MTDGLATILPVRDLARDVADVGGTLVARIADADGIAIGLLRQA